MLKKVFIIVLSVIALESIYAQSPNPIVQRLSNYEIAECKTPAAVTYNFITAILQKDFDKMVSYMDPTVAPRITKESIRELEEMFSDGKLGMFQWFPALFGEYEVAIAYVQDEWYYEEDGSLYHPFDFEVKNGMIYVAGEDFPRKGINIKKVYVTCSPSSEIDYVGFQDITRYSDTNVKVLLENVSGVWKVTGFK